MRRGPRDLSTVRRYWPFSRRKGPFTITLTPEEVPVMALGTSSTAAELISPDQERTQRPQPPWVHWDLYRDGNNTPAVPLQAVIRLAKAA